MELSDHARFLDQLRRLPEVRSEHVEAVRQAIADGTYETEPRLEAAIDRLIQELRGD
ncbi:MAG: flagellar biosynthesis anti-sigma factor FlgM [Planctomycetota bacterium]|nr:flagellar biosynthesis anti-sigma factor FlgM [Planctomycetota bacterium]